ncbi:MAG: hypothetical protein BJ554DRAFT_4553, partial [Olpidium bornovanus]
MAACASTSCSRTAAGFLRPVGNLLRPPRPPLPRRAAAYASALGAERLSAVPSARSVAWQAVHPAAASRPFPQELSTAARGRQRPHRCSSSSPCCCCSTAAAAPFDTSSLPGVETQSSVDRPSSLPDVKTPSFVYRPLYDFDLIRENAEKIRRSIQLRNVQVPNAAVDRVLELHDRVRALRTRTNQIGQQRGVVRKEGAELAKAMKKAGTGSGVGDQPGQEEEESAEVLKLKEQLERLFERGKALKTELQQVEAELEELEDAMTEAVSDFPNLVHPDAPIGNECMARVITADDGLHSTYPPPSAPSFSVQAAPSVRPALDHVAILQNLDCLDFDSAVTASGSHMYYLKNAGALLETALIQYGISCAVARGWTPVITPDIVRADMVRGCGFAPREGDIASQNYEVVNHERNRLDTDSQTGTARSSPAPPSACPAVGGRPHGPVTRYLSATAEIPLSGLVCDRIWRENDAPMRFVAFGRAYRAEAQETQSLYRVHQFSKVELYAACLPHQSEALLEEIRELQEDIMRGLGLRYRVLDMPTEELGASAYRKYDIEAWMPGRRGWGEVREADSVYSFF